MALPHTEVESLLASLCAGWPADGAPERALNLRLEGPGGGEWKLLFREGGCTLERGRDDHPAATFSSAVEDFIGLVNGSQEERTWPFLQGKLAVSGDVRLLGRLFAASG